MKIEDYQLLIQLNEQKTIRSTAKKILISQPAITQRLKYIEAHFGTVIFLRTPKQLIATDSGERILEHARELLERESVLHDQLAQAKGIVSGTVSIGASSLVSQRFLPELLETFTNSYPDVSIDLVTGVSEEIRQTAYQFHVTIVRGEPLGHFCSQHLFSDPLYLFDTQPLGGSSERPLIEFKTDPGFQKLVENWMNAQKQMFVKRSIKVDQLETAQQMMRRGLGMAILPKSMCDRELWNMPHMALTLNDKPLARETWVCVKEGVRELLQVDAFMKHIEGRKWV